MKQSKYKTTDLIRERYFIDEEKQVSRNLFFVEIKLKNFRFNFRDETLKQQKL